MEIITAKFDVVTPMFLGESSSGDGQAPPHCATAIRGPSVKGALRAHFRALSWSRIRAQHGNNQAALNQLHREEAALFGMAVKDKKGGQANFLLRIKSTPTPIKTQRELQGNSQPVQYLLCMGLFRDGMQRDHIPTGVSFELQLALKPSLTAQQKQQLLDTLLAFGLLGGLGSRARKGFGSVAITHLEKGGESYPLPQNTEEYTAEIKRLVGEQQTLAEQEPPLTAFSQLTQMQVSGGGRNPMKLLERHGKEMGMFRGYGRNDKGEHKVFRTPAEQNFKADHDWAYAFTRRKNDRNFIPQRAVFGLPHPYRLSKGDNISVESDSGRRASPLFAHVHKLPNGEHLLVHTLYQSEFLPQGIPIQASTRGNRQTYHHPTVDWDVLKRFLQRFEAKAGDVIYG